MEPPSSDRVSVLNESGRDVRTEALERAVEIALQLQGISRGEVALLLTTDERIRELNRTFRAVDDATDVLTFPSEDVPGAPLGDVAIAVPYAERQAALRGVDLDQELAYLAIHGALHLVGFEDEEEADRANMVREMNRVAVAAGLPPDEEWASLLHGTEDAS